MRNKKGIILVLLAGIFLATVYSRADFTLLNSSGLTPAITKNVEASVTQQYDWQLMRSLTASDTALTSITKAWTSIKSKFYRIPAGYNYVEIACYADGDGNKTGDPNSGTFSYKVFVCARNSSAKLVGTGTWAIGELALSHDPTKATETALTYATTDPDSSKWGELPVVSTNEWLGLLAGGTSDDLGTLSFDARGLYGFYIEVTSLTNITDLYILARGY